MKVEKKINSERVLNELRKIPGFKPYLTRFPPKPGEEMAMFQNALHPFSKMNFTALQNVHDHEIKFLHDHFYRALAESIASRIIDGSTVYLITKSDVRSAMIAVGSAARAAPEKDFREMNKDSLTGICPYCE